MATPSKYGESQGKYQDEVELYDHIACAYDTVRYEYQAARRALDLATEIPERANPKLIEHLKKIRDHAHEVATQ